MKQFFSRRRLQLSLWRYSAAVRCIFFTCSASAAEAPPVKEYIELSHALHEDMVTYPGLSEVKLYTKITRGRNGAIIDGIRMPGISGTYIDAPFHADPQGKKIADYALNQLVRLPGMVIPPCSR